MAEVAPDVKAHLDAIEQRYRDMPERSPLARSFEELNEAERAREALWKESVRRYNLRRQANRRDAWIGYHREMIARHRSTLEALVSRHEAAIAELEGEG